MFSYCKTNTNSNVKTSKMPKKYISLKNKLLKQFKKYMTIQKRNIRKRKKYMNP